MPNMKLEIDENIIKKQLAFHEENNEELQSLFPKGSQPSAIIKPSPGICIKTKDNATQQKAFVNVCISDAVPPPEDITNDQLLAILDSDDPTDFRIPMSIGQPHEEKDKSGKNICFAYDVIINPSFFDKLKDNPLFENFFMIVTIESLEEKYNVSLDKNSWVILKNKKYHGSMAEQRVRTTYPLIQELSSIKSWSSEDFTPDSKKDIKRANIDDNTLLESPLIKEMKTTKFSTDEKKKRPSFEIIGKCKINNNECLKAEVSLPALVGDANIEVKVGEDRIVLETEKYFLDELIPYSLDASCSKAFFIENVRVLVLVLAFKRS